MNPKVNIQEYFSKGKFIVPEYQRGYKWSVKKGEEESSLEYFINSLLNASSLVNEYFIEAVTVVVEGQNIILVDGQQRTTSLFLILSVLEDFEILENKLEYKVRLDSHKWLNNQISKNQIDIPDEDIQDIYYFKEAIKQIKNKIENIKKDRFKQFIKENVYLLYNEIPKEKAINTFISLNGLKAIMKDEELIKSDLLIKSSRIILQTNSNEDESHRIEWKTNENRGRLARNWDKWLYWWNQVKVKNYFGTGSKNPLYYLLVTYWKINNEGGKTIEFSFENFKSKFIVDAKSAKLHFEGLRKLQKTFEDLYNDGETYNLLGLTLNSSINANYVIEFFIHNRENKEKLKEFLKWSLVNCSIKEIEDGAKDKYREKREELKSDLSNPNLYEERGKHQAYLQLLRMNVLEMRSRKFDFEIFKTKSLEHICPQNPNQDNQEFIESQEEINANSEGINSIGNLVLLNGSANSSLSNKPLNKKKQLLFDKIKGGFLLPHTLKVFSKSYNSEDNDENIFDTQKYWTSEDVKNNKAYFFKEFDLYYEKQSTN